MTGLHWDMNYVLIIGLSILLLEVLFKLILSIIEIRFNKKKYSDEKKHLESNRTWIERQTTKLENVSVILGRQIKDELARDSYWLSSALVNAGISAESKTLFAERLCHFRKEKELIAKKFVPFLLARCQYFIEKEGSYVCLLIDSGTTLYYLFKTLSESLVKRTLNRETWIDKLFVLTNSLSGIQVAMEKGRANPNERYSQLAFRCYLLPGEPLPIYAAITGKMTRTTLEQVRENISVLFDDDDDDESSPMTKIDPDKTKYIGLTTGNWVRINETGSRCPVPMARGKGHLKFKQALVDVSDEVFVIAPLGKIFKQAELKDINNDLGLTENASVHDEECYKEVQIKEDQYGIPYSYKIKLISTQRIEGRLLHTHSAVVKSMLKSEDETNKEIQDIHDIKHILYPFDDLPSDERFELEIEFPHPITCEPHFREKFFKK